MAAEERELDTVFRAVADPTRRAILALLARGDRPVREIGLRFRLSQPGLSQHLRVLREAGLVRFRRAGRLRIYSLRQGALAGAAERLARLDRG
jgi:DNA-binding transcriptional ArsR family regulator